METILLILSGALATKLYDWFTERYTIDFEGMKQRRMERRWFIELDNKFKR